MAIKYPTAESLMGMSHCAGCGETDPPTSDNGMTECCGKGECAGADPSEAQDACCHAVEERLEAEAAAGHPAVRPPSRGAALPPGRETRGLQNRKVRDNLMSRTGGKSPQPASPKEPPMATTRYIIAATASYPVKVVSTAKAARNEADARAKGDRVDVEVRTQSTDKLIYTALGAPTMTAMPAAPAEEAPELAAEPEDAAEEIAPAAPAEDAEPAPAAEVPEVSAELEVAAAADAPEAPAPVAAPAPRAAAPVAKGARRAALGAASAEGWELLYDKPAQKCEVGRRYVGVSSKAEYALICKVHGHVHPVARLTAERTIRAAGGWCPACSA